MEDDLNGQLELTGFMGNACNFHWKSRRALLDIRMNNIQMVDKISCTACSFMIIKTVTYFSFSLIQSSNPYQ